MKQSVFPNRGRITREADGKRYNLQGGEAGTNEVPSMHRPCRSNNAAASAVEEMTDWNNARRSHQERCTNKADDGSGNSEDLISQPQKQARPVLPLMRKGVAQAAAAKSRAGTGSGGSSHSVKTSEKRAKVKPQAAASSDVTPWVEASSSESSLAALLQTFPPPTKHFHHTADQGAPKNAISKVSWGPPPSEQQLPKDKSHNRAKPRVRAGVTKRRSANKLHSVKLPPVPAVTELSFSRNFSFSFFELPKHQSPQHWLQRQRSIYVLMRQLQ